MYLKYEKEDMSWQDYGACVGVDPDLFFPKQGESIKEAKAICKQCPVREECLEFSLSIPEFGGIWGGTSMRERRPIRKARLREKRDAEKEHGSEQ